MRLSNQNVLSRGLHEKAGTSLPAFAGLVHAHLCEAMVVDSRNGRMLIHPGIPGWEYSTAISSTWYCAAVRSAAPGLESCRVRNGWDWSGDWSATHPDAGTASELPLISGAADQPESTDHRAYQLHVRVPLDRGLVTCLCPKLSQPARQSGHSRRPPCVLRRVRADGGITLADIRLNP